MEKYFGIFLGIGFMILCVSQLVFILGVFEYVLNTKASKKGLDATISKPASSQTKQNPHTKNNF